MKGKSDYSHGPSSFSVLTHFPMIFSSFSKFSQLFINMQMTYFSYRTTGYKDLSNRITDDITACNNYGLGLKSVDLWIILRFLPHVLRFHLHHEYVN